MDFTRWRSGGYNNTYNNIKVHLGHGTFMPKATNNSSKPHEDNNVIEVVSLNRWTNLDGGVDTTIPTINIKAHLGDGTCMPKTNSVARSYRLQDKRLHLVAVTISCLKKTLATFSIQLHPNKKYAHALHVVSALQILWTIL